MSPINVLLTGLPSTSTLCLRVGDINKPLDQHSLISAVTAATGLPSPSFYLRHAGSLLSQHSFVTQPGQHTVFVEIFLRRALPGGKGGFGATLKGSSVTKVTTNFDACRDLHGRRLRDVRDEVALAEYLRTHAPLKNQRDTPKKRSRTPASHDHHESTVAKIDVNRLDETIDAVNRDVEDAVAAGLRAAAERRKRQRVNHSKPMKTEPRASQLLCNSGTVSPSDSEECEPEPILSDEKGSSVRSKQS